MHTHRPPANGAADVPVAQPAQAAAAAPVAPAPGRWHAWRTAVRPPSLLVALAPVLVGAALGWHHSGGIDGALAALALLAALLMQVITNLQNDVGYTQRGAEHAGRHTGAARVGLPRATAMGWLTPRQVRAAIVALSALATALGLALVALRGWQVLALGSASLLAALAYMGGPRPIAYTPLGELTVFIFFGGVAVLGTEWLLSGLPQGAALASSVLASSAVGSIAAAALAINNHRDRAHDAEAGRQTFAVRFGAAASGRLLAALLALPFAAALGMALAERRAWPLAVGLLAPLAWRVRRDFAACPGGLAFNALLFRTFRLGLWFAAVLAAAALLG